MNDLDPAPREPEQNPTLAPEQTPPLEPEQTPPLDWRNADEPTDLFQSWAQPEAAAPARIPHLGHLCLLVALTLLGLVCATLLLMMASHFHLLGGFSVKQAATNIRYMLGEEAAIYLVTLALSLMVFPLFWDQSFFAGIHWRGATALHLGWRLPAISLGCFALPASRSRHGLRLDCRTLHRQTSPPTRPKRPSPVVHPRDGDCRHCH